MGIPALISEFYKIVVPRIEVSRYICNYYDTFSFLKKLYTVHL